LAAAPLFLQKKESMEDCDVLAVALAAAGVLVTPSSTAEVAGDAPNRRVDLSEYVGHWWKCLRRLCCRMSAE